MPDADKQRIAMIENGVLGGNGACRTIAALKSHDTDIVVALELSRTHRALFCPTEIKREAQHFEAA